MTDLPLRVGQYVLLSHDKKILALERSNSKKWSLPGGRLNVDERDWFDALNREVKEELGITIPEPKPISVAIVEDQWQVKYCVYFATEIAEVPEIKTQEEHSSFKWVDLSGAGALSFEYPHVKEVVIKYLENIS